MSKITYVKGDATSPVGEGNKLIIHCCNDLGAWGSGFVLAISKKWNKPEQKYREWYKQKIFSSPTGDMYKVLSLHDNENDYNVGIFHHEFHLGQIQVVPVANNLSVVNMIGQRSTGMANISIGDENIELPPIRYEAIKECCYRVADYALRNNCSIHTVRLGCGLARGKWETIEAILEEVFCDRNIPITVYDL